VKVALIPTLADLRYIYSTDTQMVLPYLDGFPSDRYPFYLNEFSRRAQKEGNYTIVDNGAAEGKVMDWDRLHEIADRVHADEIVLPDVIGDRAGTLEAASRVKRNSEFKYMYVIQGKTLSECFESLVDALNLNADTIGIPRHLVDIHPFARYIIAKQVLFHTWNDIPPIHLLGTSRLWPQEIKFLNKTEVAIHIRSVDTCAPFLHAIYGKTMYDELFANETKPENYFGRDISTSRYTLLGRNIRTLIEWASP
jgi:hypothetical protein